MQNQAPNFTLKEYRTNQIMSLRDFKGKIVILTFWASWCPDCLKDFPQKETFYKSLQKDQVEFLTINVTGREGNAEDGIRFIDDSPYTFPVLLDEGTKTYDAYRCSSVPTTVLIDQEQKIAATYGDNYQFVDLMQKLGTILNTR